MLGILGILSSIPTYAYSGTEEYSEVNGEEKNAERSVGNSRGSVIGGYLELWDTNQNEPHDGIIGDGDGTSFYVGTDNQYLRLYLKCLYTGQYLRYINTTLIRGSELTEILTIVNGVYQRTYVSENDITYFYYYFDIHNNAQIKSYQLSLKVEIYAIDSNGKGHKITETMTFKIQLSTRIQATGANYNSLKVHAVDKERKILPLYSGSKNQIIAFHQIEIVSGTCTDIEITLTPPTEFTLESKVAKMETLSSNYPSNTDPLWKLLSMGSNYEKPKQYIGSCDVEYKYYGKSIFEKNIKLIFEIDITPFLTYRDQIAESNIGTIKNNAFISNYIIYQGTTSESFSLSFTNTGNIDLKDVEVELYTDDAEFFFKSQYYYDESSHAYKRSYFKSIFFGDVYMDQIVTSTFPIEIVKNLPPGLYSIPIKYKIKYELEGFTDIEVDVADYHEAIVAARADNNKGYQPFLLIHVQEGYDPNDQQEPDVFAFSPTSLQVGKSNVILTVQLSNLENYQLNNVNAQLQVGGDSPLQRLNTKDFLESWISPLEREFTLYSAYDQDHLSSSIYELHYMVDVDSDADPGQYEVPMIINCLDCINNERSTTTKLQLNIQPDPSRFLVTEIYSSTVEPNKDFNLTITVFNSGGSNARNVSLMFNGSSNLFSAESNVKGPKNINKGQEEVFYFKINAGDLEPGSTHSLSFFVTCEDCIGNIRTYDSNPKLTVPIMVKKIDPEFAPKFIISETVSTEIKPNSFFTLKVKLLNSGGSTAKNVRVLFNGSSNLFSAVDNIKSLPTVLKNQEAQFEFRIKAGDVEPGNIYRSSIHVSYEDSKGEQYSFDSNEEQVISLKTEDPEPEGWQINEGLALIVLGIFILIGALLFGLLRTRAERRAGRAGGRERDLESIKGKNGRVNLQATQVQAAGASDTYEKKHGLFGKKPKNIDYSSGQDTAMKYASQQTTTTQTAQTRYQQQIGTGAGAGTAIYNQSPQTTYQQQPQIYQPAQTPYYNGSTTTSTDTQYLPPRQTPRQY